MQLQLKLTVAVIMQHPRWHAYILQMSGWCIKLHRQDEVWREFANWQYMRYSQSDETLAFGRKCPPDDVWTMNQSCTVLHYPWPKLTCISIKFDGNVRRQWKTIYLTTYLILCVGIMKRHDKVNEKKFKYWAGYVAIKLLKELQHRKEKEQRNKNV